MFCNVISLYDIVGYRLILYVNNKLYIVNLFYYVGIYFCDFFVLY